MVMNRLQVRHIKLAFYTLAVLKLEEPASDISCFDNPKRRVAGCSEPVLKSQPIGQSVTGQRSDLSVERMKARQDLRLLNIAANKSRENRVALRARKLAFNPVMGIGTA
jgi:hypothetical protein